MSKYTAAEVIEYVESLRDDAQGQNLRSDIQLRLNQHAMTDVPWIPDWLMAAGKTLVMNSPTIAELARQINAVMASYTTNVTAIPEDVEYQNKADEVEKAYTLRRADLFTPQVVLKAHWRQLIVAYDFYKLQCGDVNSKNPWSVIQPDPMSCYFLMGEESYKTMRPSIIGREYEQSIRKARELYDSRENKMPVYNGKTWDFERVSDDFASNVTGNFIQAASSIKNLFQTSKFYELDDGETTYVVGLDVVSGSSKRTGKILWDRDNLTGGSSYVMVPGYMTGATELREKFLPHLWGPMTVQFQIDGINTLRATRSLNIKPQVLMERNPQLFELASRLNITRPVPDGYESLGSDTIIELDGRPHFWMLPEDKDLAALEETKQRELERLISTEMALTQADVIKDAAVRNIQLALGVRAQQQGIMLNFEAIGEREILKMWAHSITCEDGYGNDEWSLFAKSDQGRVRKGESISISKSKLEFEHHVEVSTASLSPQERQFLVQVAVENKAAHVGTWPEVIDAAGYQNRKEQEEALVEEEGYEGATIFYTPWLEPVFRQRMAERNGILIPSAIPPGASTQPTATGPAPNAFPVPQTESVSATSGGT